MKVWGWRLYGAFDLRLEEFEIPEIKADEILLRLESDSLCMSSYKLYKQGQKHRRVQYDLKQVQPVLGHEFCGTIAAVGQRWKSRYAVADKCVLQTTFNGQEPWSPGYSYPFFGGCMSYAILPAKVMETDNLLPCPFDGFFKGSLVEPYSCVIGALKASFHTSAGSYEHKMNIKKGGSCCLLGGTGPMGLAMIDTLLSAEVRPRLLIILGRSLERLKVAEQLFPQKRAEQMGVKMIFLANEEPENLVSKLKTINDGNSFDDVLLFSTDKKIMEQSAQLLADDACLNVFAGPGEQQCMIPVNFYDIHYARHNFAATSGGTTEDMHEAVTGMSNGKLRPEILIDRIGGLNTVADALIELPQYFGRKTLFYTQKKLPLFKLTELEKLAKGNSFFSQLQALVTDGVWNVEAEKYLLDNAENFVS